VIGCAPEALVLHADLTVEASTEVVQGLSYPVALSLGISPDADGRSILGSSGASVPKYHLVCEAPTDPWAVEAELTLRPDGRCRDLDPHIVVEAVEVSLDGPCTSDLDVAEAFAEGDLFAEGIAPAFPDLGRCGRYHDVLVVELLP